MILTFNLFYFFYKKNKITCLIKGFHVTTLAHGICNMFMHGPLREDLTRMSASCPGSCKDLLERTSTGSPEDLLISDYLHVQNYSTIP